MKAKRRFFLFSIRMAFVSFCWLIALVKTFIIILNRSGKSKHSCLVPDFREKNSVFSWKKIYFILAALSLHCCTWAFSSCGKRGFTLSVWCTGFSLRGFPCGVQALGHMGVRSYDLLMLRLSCPIACGIFPDQSHTHVPSIGRQILNHKTTREAPNSVFITKYVNCRSFIDAFIKLRKFPSLSSLLRIFVRSQCWILSIFYVY